MGRRPIKKSFARDVLPAGAKLPADAPVAYERTPELVARRIRDDDLRPRVAAEDDRVLAEHAPEGHGLLAIHAVDEPGGLAPGALRVLFVSDAGLDPVDAENQEVAHDDVPLLVDFARQKHRPGVVRRQDRERLL